MGNKKQILQYEPSSWSEQDPPTGNVHPPSASADHIGGVIPPYKTSYRRTCGNLSLHTQGSESTQSGVLVYKYQNTVLLQSTWTKT